MTIVAFLGQLRELGVELRYELRDEGEKLVVHAPKGALTPQLADELRRRKPELLEFLRMGANASAGRTMAAAIPQAQLVRRPDGVLEAPLSFGQRRLFYLDRLDPEIPVWNVPHAIWLSANRLDLAALQGALDDIVQRHAVLRTTLDLGAEGPIQRVAPTAAVELAHVELSAVDNPAERCRQVLDEHACRPFDLSAGPLVRAVLVTLTARSHVLLITAHHIAIDGWSLGILEKELLAFYEARIGGRPATLPPLAIQYADYAAWQVTGTDDPDRARRVAYWVETLAQPLPVLELPAVHPKGIGSPRGSLAHARGQSSSGAGDTAVLDLPTELIDQLTAIGRREGATLYMVLLAAYATLLRRVTHQTEIVIGSPIANRNQTQTLDLIGYFANTLALRIELSGEPTFRELVVRVREVCTRAYANQDIPFEEIVEKIGVARDLSRSPVFQTLFAFEDATVALPPIDLTASLVIERRETIHAKVARNDLSAWVAQTPAGLRVTLEYSTQLFDPPAVEDLLVHFGELLRGAVKEPDQKLERLPLLSAAQRTRIVDEWNATDRALPDVRGAHQLFERQVDRAPDRTAVVFGSEAITYRELDERANRLAHHLFALGATQSAFVGVFFERSPQMLVALLAIQKVGGTYIPLDPDYPPDRVALMVEDSGLGFIVTTGSLVAKLPKAADAVTVIAVDRDAEAIAQRSTARLPCTLPSEHPCYVLYTSGSTGKPNGVLVPHRALVNFLQAMAVRPGLAADDTLLAVTTLSFDISGLEMYLPLVVGAKLVIASRDQVTDGRKLRALLESSGATVMQATPATWRLLIAADWRGPGTFKALCGGEAFPPDLVAQLRERASVWNMYGPTETTIWSTCAELGEGPITVGRPIDNTSIYILDALGQPVPVGISGDLIIGGQGVSLGYLNRPELTASRFLPDPFRGGVMYRTGDRAAWRRDGQIVFQGRADHQVKVRGYRIELGEIEAVLAEHPSVDRCVVTVREDRPGDTRVVAYVVLRHGAMLTSSDVRKHLRKKLPDYMIPQHVVELEALPLTPAGKINRRGLPAPAGVASTVKSRVPQTSAELTVAKIWKELLHTEHVAATDNFFEIGGHSLLSMAAVARIQAESGVTVSLRDLLLLSLEQIAQRLPP